MRKIRPISKAFALAAAGAIVLTACSTVDDADGDSAATGGATAAAGEVKIGAGVTEEPCPEAINEQNGCIYLGILSDLTEGPFAALAVPIVNAQKEFWRQVNQDGGIAGYEVDIDTYTRDTKYQAAEHAAAYQQIEPNILALAQTLGTINTAAILPDMDKADIVGAPASWWSGYAFQENDFGLIIENGYSYCTEAIVGLDWFTENNAKPESIAAAGYPGDYGGDSAAGVEKWAEANGVTDVTVIQTAPNQVAGNQDAAVSAISKANPDVVVLAVGPAENAEIVGKLAAGGFTGRFLGSLPTWNPVLLKSAAAPALTSLYHQIAPSEQWDGTSAGVAAMKASTGGTPPPNGGYVIGWLMSYPMLAVLEKAAANGDLTRAGVRAAVAQVEVDYQGMSTNQSYNGNGKEIAVSAIKVYEPNEEAPLGVVSTGDFYEGATWDKVDYAEACVATS